MATRPVAHRPLPQHMVRMATVNAVVYVVIALVIAALAASRATAHVLTASAVAAIAAGAAAVLVFMRWPDGMYDGAAEVLRGESVLACEPGCASEPATDPWTRRVWLEAIVWSGLAAVWAAAGAGLIAVALNGKRARLVVVFAALAGLAGAAAVVVDTVARWRGAHAARLLAARPSAPIPLRRRAWRQVALPLALSQGVANAAMAWLLFHDYTRASAGGLQVGQVLTRRVALADALVIVLILAVLFGSRAVVWGATDAALGRVALDEPDAQHVPARAAVGPQGLVYVGVIAVLLAPFAALALPSRPNLGEVAVLRGVFSFVVVYVVAGLSFTRGAVNGRAAVEAVA